MFELAPDGWCLLQGVIAQVVVAPVGVQSQGMENCADRVVLREPARPHSMLICLLELVQQVY
jgi:hypothetical protein